MHSQCIYNACPGNAYFEGVQKNDGKGFYPFTGDCDRIERPLIDEERGVVWTNCIFDMDGTVSQIKLATTGEIADMSTSPARYRASTSRRPSESRIASYGASK